MRSIATTGILGIFAVVLMTGAGAGPCSAAASASDSEQAAVDSAQVWAARDSLGTDELPTRVVVYYFHPTLRCESCLQLESLAHDALEASFAEELAKGQVQWQVYDFESPAGARLAEDFEIEGSTITVVNLLGAEISRWKNLDDAWYLLYEPDSLRGYVRDEVRACLGAGR